MDDANAATECCTIKIGSKTGLMAHLALIVL